ncbi:hypothetical protein RvY_01677 [Ramazzottius varieornatus]|uniref:OTU domain-containing protein n=1 Tax=Ramazzottius varieornatus TaxID=947166 RepID=A0A1D1UN59_RAMVA|nr:hypothetical protein RvY_01677 [Ramazzottius varieornatus]
MGLVSRNVEAGMCMEEAIKNFQSPAQLRSLFELRISEGAPAPNLYSKFIQVLASDYSINQSMTEEEAESIANIASYQVRHSPGHHKRQHATLKHLDQFRKIQPYYTSSSITKSSLRGNARQNWQRNPPRKRKPGSDVGPYQHHTELEQLIDFVHPDEDTDTDLHNLGLSGEYLNTVWKPNTPPHTIQMEEGMHCYLLRNLSPDDGLLNNTKIEIQKIRELITAEILSAKVTDHNLEIVPIIGDGECLYRTISFYLFDSNQSHYTDIRTAIAEELQNQPQKYDAFGATNNDHEEQNLEELIKSVSTPGSWGSKLSLKGSR